MNLKKNILKFTAISFIGIICFLFVPNSNNVPYGNSISCTSIESSTPDQSNSKLFFVQLVDHYVDDDKLTTLYNEPDILERLITFNKCLNEQFNYYELSFQALQSLEYFKGNDNFVKIYNRKGGQIKNQKIEIDDQICYVTSLNTIRTNQNFFNEYLPFIQEGNAFISEDYVLSDLTEIPIILGSHYKKYYEVGDIIQLNFLEKNFDFYIKGFFTENLSIDYNSKNIDMDDYICMPSFNCTIGSEYINENLIWWVRYYLQKNNGYIKYSSQDDLEYIKEVVSDLAQKYDLDYSIIDSVNYITQISHIDNAYAP